MALGLPNGSFQAPIIAGWERVLSRRSEDALRAIFAQVREYIYFILGPHPNQASCPWPARSCLRTPTRTQKSREASNQVNCLWQWRVVPAESSYAPRSRRTVEKGGKRFLLLSFLFAFFAGRRNKPNPEHQKNETRKTNAVCKEIRKKRKMPKFTQRASRSNRPKTMHPLMARPTIFAMRRCAAVSVCVRASCTAILCLFWTLFVLASLQRLTQKRKKGTAKKSAASIYFICVFL